MYMCNLLLGASMSDKVTGLSVFGSTVTVEPSLYHPETSHSSKSQFEFECLFNTTLPAEVMTCMHISSSYFSSYYCHFVVLLNRLC